MKRSKLEGYLGKKVKIKIFDGDEYIGFLHKTGELQFKNNPNLYIIKNCFFLTPEIKFLFKCSHVIKCEEV